MEILRSVPLHHKNSSPHLPPQLPVWISPEDPINKSIPGFFTLTESTTYQLKPINKSSNWSTIKESSSSSKSTCWLIRIEEAKPGKMRLLNLLSKCPIQHLPETFPREKLGFLEAGDEKWTVLDDQWTRYEYIINHRGKLCAIDNKGRALSIDFSLKLSEIASPICGHGGQQKRLVESLGDLVLVDRYQLILGTASKVQTTFL